jgi:hypothetical protein
MNGIIAQIASNAVNLAVFLLFFSAAAVSAGWAVVAFTRLIQLQLAINITITRELASIQQMLAVPYRTTTQQPVYMPSSTPAAEPIKPGKTPASEEGEIYLPTDSDLADQEAIRNLKGQQISDQGMVDEALQAKIDEEIRRHGELADEE